MLCVMPQCDVSPSVPSVTEMSAMLHTSRPDNASGVLLQLHTAPNCQYKVRLSGAGLSPSLQAVRHDEPI